MRRLPKDCQIGNARFSPRTGNSGRNTTPVTPLIKPDHPQTRPLASHVTPDIALQCENRRKRTAHGTLGDDAAREQTFVCESDGGPARRALNFHQGPGRDSELRSVLLAGAALRAVLDHLWEISLRTSRAGNTLTWVEISTVWC